MSKKPGQDIDVVLEGVVLPVSWNASGEVEEVSLMTFDEAEYRIERTAIPADQVSRLIRKHVSLSAIVREGRVIRTGHIEIRSDPGIHNSGDA
jgi:hypothetical protein